MKKAVMILIVAAIVFSTFASERHFGYGLSVSGSTQSKNDISLSLFYRPFDFEYMNPYFRAECGFASVKAYLGFEVFKSFKNPLQFTTVNISKYSPSVGVGASYKEKNLCMYCEIAPLRVVEKDFLSEYLTVGFEYLPQRNEKSFTVFLFRVTAML